MILCDTNILIEFYKNNSQSMSYGSDIIVLFSYCYSQFIQL
jgi:predicted nucleic acid-binding protein